MKILKDFIRVGLFIASLFALLYTNNYCLGAMIIIPVSIIYIIKHITLQKTLSKELKNKVQLFEAMFNLSRDVILYRNISNKIVACNNQLMNVLGLSKDELIGDILNNVLKKSIVSSNHSDKVLLLIDTKTAEVIKTGESVQFFEKFEFINKQEAYYNVLISPVCNGQGHISGTIVVARDVTLEYISAQRLKEKEQQLKCILENMPICAFMKDKDGNFIVGSSLFEELINCKNSNMQNFDLTDFYPADHIKYVLKEDSEVFKTKKSLVSIRQVLFPNQNFLGRVHKTPVFDDNGNVEYLVVMYENIEVEKEVERQKEYFVETLIHDLKIPTLAQLRGLELVRNETIGKINLEQKELITQIEGSCRYILDMISMVLKTYRFENGQKKIMIENINVQEVLQECIEDINDSALEKNINIVYSLKDSNISVEADRGDIRTVILNLLSNAIMYSNKNNTIFVDINVVSSHIHFEIISHGITLSERECQTMFNKVTAEKPKYTTIGHGIGLYLCKKIIESHYGQICASTDGKNYNKFIFTLPLKHENHSFKTVTNI